METIQNEKSELQRKAALMEGPFFYPLQCIWKKTRKLVFSTANGELAFEQKGKVRIVAGDPRATTLDKAVLVFKEFVKDSHAQGFAVCGYYFSEGFALESGHFAHKCGVSRFENLRQWSLNGPQSEEARRALRKAKEAKLSIERLEPTDLKQNLEALSLADQKWQKSKGWVRIRFLLSRFQATLEEVSRGSEVLFCSRNSESYELESLLSLRRYMGSSHWYVDSLMQVPGGDRFALDATLAEAMRWLKEERRAEALALGFCPGIIEDPTTWVEKLLALWRKTRFLYSPEGLYSFKRKYSSLELQRYLLLDPGYGALKQLSTMEAATLSLRLNLRSHQ